MGTDPVSQSVLRNIPCGDKRGETVLFAGQVLSRPGLFKRWIVLSTGLITIQRISIRETTCAIQFSLASHAPWACEALALYARVCAHETLTLFWECYDYEKKTKKTTVLQSSSVLYSECIGPQLNFQVEKKKQVVIHGFLPFQWDLFHQANCFTGPGYRLHLYLAFKVASFAAANPDSVDPTRAFVSFTCCLSPSIKAG